MNLDDLDLHDAGPRGRKKMPTGPRVGHATGRRRPLAEVGSMLAADGGVTTKVGSVELLESLGTTQAVVALLATIARSVDRLADNDALPHVLIALAHIEARLNDLTKNHPVADGRLEAIQIMAFEKKLSHYKPLPLPLGRQGESDD
jgi:hypothetical protein